MPKKLPKNFTLLSQQFTYEVVDHSPPDQPQSIHFMTDVTFPAPRCGPQSSVDTGFLAETTAAAEAEYKSKCALGEAACRMSLSYEIDGGQVTLRSRCNQCPNRNVAYEAVQNTQNFVNPISEQA